MKPYKKEPAYQDKDVAQKTLGKPVLCQACRKQRRTFSKAIEPRRALAIQQWDNLWVEETRLEYYFYPRGSSLDSFTTVTDSSSDYNNARDILRDAFATWEATGMRLNFVEVNEPDHETHVRIAITNNGIFETAIGREATLAKKQTMEVDAEGLNEYYAIHEVGHALGFEHEHQNPRAGIIWNEEAVFDYVTDFGWTRSEAQEQIMKPFSESTLSLTKGGSWDPKSVMNYFLPGGEGMFKRPASLEKTGIKPNLKSLSSEDERRVLAMYKPSSGTTHRLNALQSVPLGTPASGQQYDFIIEPESTGYYNVQTFGQSDGVMVLFEEYNGDLKYVTADDNSGNENDAHIRLKLFKGRKYVLRHRCYYAEDMVGIMMW